MKGNVDPLTGLPSGGAVYELIGEALLAEDGVVLALLDLDSFAEINTAFGAEAGDRALQTVASLLTEEAAAEGSVARAVRVAGDEFALILPETTLERAFLRMERFRIRVQQSAERFALPEGQAMTITIGVAQYPRDARDGAALFKAADAALMNAKEQGRNAVGLPPNEEMVMKSCYYSAGAVRRLKALAERLGRKESVLLREALSDILRKYDNP